MKYKLLYLGIYFFNYMKAFPVVIVWDFVLKRVSNFSTSPMDENRSYPERRPDNFRPNKWVGRNLTKRNDKFCVLEEAPLYKRRGRSWAGFRAALQGRTWVSWWRTGCPWISNVSLQSQPEPCSYSQQVEGQDRHWDPEAVTGLGEGWSGECRRSSQGTWVPLQPGEGRTAHNYPMGRLQQSCRQSQAPLRGVQGKDESE